MGAATALLGACLLAATVVGAPTELGISELRGVKSNYVVGFYDSSDETRTKTMRNLLRKAERIINETSPEYFKVFKADISLGANAQLAKEMGLTYGDHTHIFVRSEFDGVHEYTGTRDPESLARYVGLSVVIGDPTNVYRVERLAELDALLALMEKEGLEGPAPVFVQFASYSCSFCQRLRPHFDGGAALYRGRVPFATIMCEGTGFTPETLGLCRALGVRRYPTLALYLGPGEWLAYPHLDYTMGSIEAWFHSLADNAETMVKRGIEMAEFPASLKKYHLALSVQIDLPEGPNQMYKRENALRADFETRMREQVLGADGTVDANALRAMFEEQMKGGVNKLDIALTQRGALDAAVDASELGPLEAVEAPLKGRKPTEVEAGDGPLPEPGSEPPKWRPPQGGGAPGSHGGRPPAGGPPRPGGGPGGPGGGGGAPPRGGPGGGPSGPGGHPARPPPGGRPRPGDAPPPHHQAPPQGAEGEADTGIVHPIPGQEFPHRMPDHPPPQDDLPPAHPRDAPPPQQHAQHVPPVREPPRRHNDL